MKLIKNLFSLGNDLPIEREVRRRLTWRMVLLSLAPVPCVLLLMNFLYCLICLNTQTIEILLKKNSDMAMKIDRLERLINGQGSESPVVLRVGESNCESGSIYSTNLNAIGSLPLESRGEDR